MDREIAYGFKFGHTRAGYSGTRLIAHIVDLVEISWVDDLRRSWLMYDRDFFSFLFTVTNYLVGRIASVYRGTIRRIINSIASSGVIRITIHRLVRLFRIHSVRILIFPYFLCQVFNNLP